MVVAGGALAAAGQQSLSAAIPAATDGAAVLRLGFEQVLGIAPPAVAAPAAVPALGAVTAEPVVADAASLVKAADLQRAAADAADAAAKSAAKSAAEAAAAERARADAARRAEAAPAAAAAGVRMVVGRITSVFGLRWGTMHEGIDFAAPIGTPIHVPLAGTVISSGAASGFGMWVRVQHADGTITVYGHVNRSFVRVGQRVAAGDVIAEVGNRGESTGPHLHFAVQRNGVYVNPRPWLDQHGVLN